MYKIFKNTLALGLLALLAAATPVAANNIANAANAVQKRVAKTILTVTPTPFGPGSELISWTASGSGPFSVTLVDLSTGQRIQSVSTNNTFVVFSGLNSGKPYRVSVGDVNLLSANFLAP